MPKALTLNVPDEVYQSLQRIAAETGQGPEELSVDMLIGAIHRFDTDPLLKLAGCLDIDAGDAVERHDYYVGHTLTEEEEREMRSRGGGDG